jgi:hypothetical protein
MLNPKLAFAANLDLVTGDLLGRRNVATGPPAVSRHAQTIHSPLSITVTSATWTRNKFRQNYLARRTRRLLPLTVMSAPL